MSPSSSDGLASGLLSRKPGRPAWLTRVGLLALSLLVTFVVVRLIGKIDWAAVRDGLSHLSWWHPVVLLAMLLLRQFFNALPLVFFIPGVSPYKGMLNDQGAALMSALAPPPSDIALRVAMFTSWGVPVAQGVAGTVMNTLGFYIVRFGTPILGFALLATTGQPPGLRWLDLLSIAVCLATLLGVLVVVRSERLAHTFGIDAGRVARRVRHRVDPEAWAAACVNFRRDIAATFRTGFPRSLLALSAMLVVELAMLLACLRFVGISASEVSLYDVAVAFLFAYPLTVFPFAGIGIVDAALLAAFVEAGGLQVEAASVAALIVWRVFAVAGPILLGVVALAVWRRSVRGGKEADADAHRP